MAAPEAKRHRSSKDPVAEMYVFLYQGLWSEQLHARVLASLHANDGSTTNTQLIEQEIEEDRTRTWVDSAKSKKRQSQLDTMQAMLAKGAPGRGILGFLRRHVCCQRRGVIMQAVKHHGYSATFARIMEDGWLTALHRLLQTQELSDVSDEDEHEGVLGL
jgi:hypothetical protein